ncbi:MAG: BCD family MFS transporter [Anaerolineales bacterium]|nr:BCD family MFS transporter [Anaerolineales bacterium]
MNTTSSEAAAVPAGSTEGVYRFSRLLRLSTFQVGSALGDILVTSVWNRIMINELGMNAAPVGLLIALRYLLAPLSLLAGYWSDTRPWLGFHRTPYIWSGRLLIVLSYPLLPLSLSRFAANHSDIGGWLIAILCFLMYGTGTLLSGGNFLALVRDSVPKQRQGFAIGVIETALILMFPIAAISLGRAMREFSLEAFWSVSLTVMAISAFFWFFAIAGIERRFYNPRAGNKESALQFGVALRKIWSDVDTRRFFIFLALATLAAWAQEAILEPFGAQALGQDIEQTTRYSAYWQTATVIFLIACAVRFRKRPAEQNVRVTKIGLGVMTAGMFLLALAAFGAQLRLLQISLFVFGAGFGLYTFGAFSLLIAMSSDAEAGMYLGLWTICVLLSRGIGIALGGIFRDLILSLTGTATVTYGIIFLLEAAGLALSIYFLARVDVIGFGKRVGRIASGDTVAASELGL